MPYFMVRGPTPLSVAYSPEAAQFFLRIADPGTTRKNQYAALIDGLVGDGVWSSLDLLHIYAADIQGNALVNLKSSSFTGITVGGGLTFTTDRGFNFASGSDYVNSQMDLSAGGTQFTTDAASIGVWAVVGGGDAPFVEDVLISTKTNIYPAYAGQCYTRVNDATPAGGLAVADALGFTLGVRTSGTGRESYRNGSSLGSLGSVSSSAPAAGQVLVCGQNVGGQAAAFCVGGNINSVQGSLYTRLRTYMTAVGVP
jgi:hypothetical protein